MKKFLLGLGALLLTASTAFAQSTFQFPTSPWGGFAPAKIQCGQLYNANFNTTNDQAIAISVPSTTFNISVIEIDNPSVSLTTAQGGFYSATSKGGVAVVASSQAYSTLTTNTAATTGNHMTATLATAGTTTEFNGTASTIYFSLTTAQGAPATANIRVFCDPHY